MAERFGSYLLPKLDQSQRDEIEDRRGDIPGVPPPVGPRRYPPPQPPLPPRGNMAKDLGIQDIGTDAYAEKLRRIKERAEKDLAPSSPDMPVPKPGV